ncbi:MAG: aminotransferase class I/II-fold pyridoxal phosphate-dependent enzyme [Alphaproteobacteria bacterium]
MSNLFDSLYLNSCVKCKKLGQERTLVPYKPYDINFASNDYLNLSNNKDVIEAGYKAAKEYGAGATGSRLLSGNYPLLSELEEKIRKAYKTEAAIIFQSGYQANSTVLSSLLDFKVLGEKPNVLFDRNNHHSLYHACFLSNCNLIRYRHLDYDHLHELLQKHQNDKNPKFIVTETFFGMDGDIVDLNRILKMAHKFGAFVYLDEAHAVGLFGKDGYGLSTTCDIVNIPIIIMGAFGKAVGVSGAFVTSSHAVCDYLINKCPVFIYSTAPSPFIIGAVIKAWEIISSLNKERKDLFEKSKFLCSKLENKGFKIRKSKTPVIPIFLNDVMKAKEFFLNKNILISAIRSPTVPPNTSRIRVSISLKHTKKDLEKFVSLLEEFAQNL